MINDKFEFESVKRIPIDLVPTQKHRNDVIRSQLEDKGDDGTAIRHTIHFFSKTDVPNAVNGRYIAEIYSELGFYVSASDDLDFVEVSNHAEVASAKFDDFVDDASEFLESVGWGYDGWFAKIIQPYTLQ